MIENNNIKNNQSNETYSAIMENTERKTNRDTFRSKNLHSRGENNRKQSSIFGQKNENIENAYNQEGNNTKKSAKILIANIKNMHKREGETIHSRESNLKMKTKDSHEYSYGVDIGKMEPKMKENENSGPISPNIGREIDNNINNFSLYKKKNENSVRHFSMISNPGLTKNKILFSKAREKYKVNMNKYNVSHLN